MLAEATLCRVNNMNRANRIIFAGLVVGGKGSCSATVLNGHWLIKAERLFFGSFFFQVVGK